MEVTKWAALTLSQTAFFSSVGVWSPLPAEEEAPMPPLVMGGTSLDSSSTLKRSTAWATSSKALAPSFSLVAWNRNCQCHTRGVVKGDKNVKALRTLVGEGESREATANDEATAKKARENK